MEFRPPSYFALAALIDGPLHGYAIVRRAAELSDGTVSLSTGTLYALLERAIAEGWCSLGSHTLREDERGATTRSRQLGVRRLRPRLTSSRTPPGP